MIDYLNNRWDNWVYIWIMRIIVFILLFLGNIKIEMLALTVILMLITDIVFTSYKYYKYKNEMEEKKNILNSLDKTYYVHELLSRPKNEEAAIYYDIMKLANRDMIGEIAKVRNEHNDFRELIEEWIHEMKTPITSINLSVGEGENIELIEEVKRLNDILELCLTAIRIGDLQRDYHLDTINTADLVHGIIMEEKQMIRSKDIHFKVKVSLNSKYKSDFKWSRFIIYQIIINAIKYSDYGGVVEITEFRNEYSYAIAIKNYGKGIPKSELPRIFEKGFTGSKIERKSASGLGLYLVKQTADKMNISIKVDSIENEYTEFMVVFPQESQPFNSVS
ncbi:MAG: HAMP domain-containing histidine kinase [Tissierellia bacterium]|nr:HAMP domain-containing histidine kinase [Tissierellia bacterium]